MMNAAGRAGPANEAALAVSLLFSPRRPSLVTVGGASLCSVWNTENLIIRANAAFPLPSVFTHKIPARASPLWPSRRGAHRVGKGHKGAGTDAILGPGTQCSAGETSARCPVCLSVYKEKDELSQAFRPEIRPAHLSLTRFIGPHLHSQMRLIKTDFPPNL